MSRYPIHFHVSQHYGRHCYAKYNSIHHSFQRAVAIHSTDYTVTKGNVGFDIVGHMFFVETGTERLVASGGPVVRTFGWLSESINLARGRCQCGITLCRMGRLRWPVYSARGLATRRTDRIDGGTPLGWSSPLRVASKNRSCFVLACSARRPASGSSRTRGWEASHWLRVARVGRAPPHNDKSERSDCGVVQAFFVGFGVGSQVVFQDMWRLGRLRSGSTSFAHMFAPFDQICVVGGYDLGWLRPTLGRSSPTVGSV